MFGAHALVVSETSFMNIYTLYGARRHPTRASGFRIQLHSASREKNWFFKPSSLRHRLVWLCLVRFASANLPIEPPPHYHLSAYFNFLRVTHFRIRTWPFASGYNTTNITCAVLCSSGDLCKVLIAFEISRFNYSRNKIESLSRYRRRLQRLLPSFFLSEPEFVGEKLAIKHLKC